MLFIATALSVITEVCAVLWGCRRKLSACKMEQRAHLLQIHLGIVSGILSNGFVLDLPYAIFIDQCQV